MAIESISIPIGSEMPSFVLRDPDGVIQVSDYAFGKKGLLVAFTCNHCPYAIAVWPRLIALGKHAMNVGVNVIAVNPNINPDYPDDSPAKMSDKMKEWKIPFPYVFDETQKVARAFDAQCTPDLYLYDSHKKLVYHGRLDDNWKEPERIKREELKEAIDALVAGRPISAQQFPSMGCSIKWRS